MQDPRNRQISGALSRIKIAVYSGLNCEFIVYQGHAESDKRIKLLFDKVTRHYHVIANLTGAMAKRYVCAGCNKSCKNGVVHTCEQTCSECMLSPPCTSVGLGSRAIYATDTLGVRSVSIIIKRKREVNVRARVSFVSVAVRSAL